MLLAAGVLPPEIILLVLPGVSSSFWGTPEVVGDKAVKGWCKCVGHDFGEPGMYGNGYDGVRSDAFAAGVGAALGRTVLDDSVDSVESVELVRTAPGIAASAAFRDGDPDEASSSGIGDTLFDPESDLSWP